MIFTQYIYLIIIILISIAFFTLLERKMLGYIQIRKGPFKVGYYGIVQPFADAMKLMSKEFYYPLNSMFNLFMMSPIMNLFLVMFMWLLYPSLSGMMSFFYGMIFFMCSLSFSVFMVLWSGWSSNSKYSLLGGLRSVAQSISYEVSLAFLLMSCVMLIGSYCFLDLKNIQKDYIWMMFMLYPIFLMIMCSLIAETNRTPFDFAEGESELVSGFNIEYGGILFTLIFLAEYGSILLMSMMMTLLFMGGMEMMFFLSMLLVACMFLIIRGTFPRFRYDKLMMLSWKVFLPCSMSLIVMIMGMGKMV
uniref:NADH-ubiquinone oxidoreductase chain 1 n=1 Tax=Glomeridesmus spelaeus TaxID=2071608 RepID=A0A2I7MLA7_9MYRI|nr:NADH dehydrogenase subunit 1 [Glomeridesmus spelaeus]QCF39676.1 NADH dehydrogenase subunit 1 [Glomeridesmus spelaeus]QCF39689.1 NADH dehydrogenase subunit 1 [Glomeridesmus spelaeus]